MPPLLKRSCYALLLMTLLLRTESAMTQQPTKNVTVEGITEYEFQNGLKLLLFPDPSRPTVTVNLTVFVGSRHEGYGEAGMAHLLEHMLFKGSPLFPEVPKVLQERGARFNGTTWTDRTNYYETLPASDDNLDFALRLEADRMVNSFVRGEDLSSERTVGRNEFERGENSPQRILSQRIHACAFDWHNYGKSTIGNRSDIERVPITNLREFYKKHYQPDNAMLVIAGQFDEERALELTEKYFGSMPRPDRRLDKTYTEEPPQDGERTVTLKRVGDVGIVGVAYHIPSGPHPDFPPVQTLSYILAMEPSGRLYKDLVETKQAASVSGYAYSFHDPGLAMFNAEVRDPATLPRVRELLIKSIESTRDGVKDEEVARAKAEILKYWELALNDSTQIAVSLSNWAAQGDWRLFFLYRDRIEKVTVADVQEVAQKYFQENNRTVGLFIPTEEPKHVTIPATPDVAALVEDYKGREAIAQGEVFDPAPANIESRTTRLTLGSGIQATFLPKKTRGESVHLRFTLRYGNEDNLKGYATAARLLPELMTRGTKKLTYEQLQDELNNHRVTLSADGSRGRAAFYLQTKRSNLAAGIELLGQVLREPRLGEEEFEVYRRERLAFVESVLTDPRYLASTKLRRLLSPYPPGDVRYVPTPEETLELYRDLTLRQVRSLHAEYLGAEHGELSVVGDFDPAAVQAAFEQILDGWQATKDYARVEDRAFTDVPGGQFVINTPGKANATYSAGETIAMSDSHPDYPALVIGNFILGGGSLSSRLGDRVRQKEGLSYGVGSQLSADSLNDRAQLNLYAISNPENVPKVVTVIREELDKLLQDGVTAEELDRAKQGYLQRQTVSRTNDGTLVDILTSTSYADRTMQHYADFEKAIAGLTVEQVNAALQKYVSAKRLVVVTAGDLEKKP